MSVDPSRKILWAATVPGLSLVERVEVAAATGFGQVSFSPADDAPLRASGRTPDEFRAWANDLGVTVEILDAVIEWYPHPPPKRPMGGAAFSVDEVLDIAAAFGGRSVSALPAFPSDLDNDGYVEHFASLCDKAAERGLLIHIEFVPLGGIKGIEDAWDIVRKADRANGGVLFDSWHFWYGSRDFDALEQIPAEKLMAVQLNDGPEHLDSLIKATFNGRYLTGDGVMDLERMVRILDTKGALAYSGPEVLSAELNALPPLEAARRAGASYDALLKSVLG
ncbi:MAG: sugar phosphate isomerase/epimerase family protein [Acidimicrobiia bacterium]